MLLYTLGYACAQVQFCILYSQGPHSPWAWALFIVLEKRALKNNIMHFLFDKKILLSHT